jgi:hypothetical protein
MKGYKNTLMQNKFVLWRSVLLINFLLFGGVFLVLSIDKKFSPSIKAEASGVNTIFLPLAQNFASLKTIFGSEMNPISVSQGLEKMTDAEASWVRRNGVLWSAVEPVQGAGYNWSVLASLEQEFLLARSNGMEVIMIVRGTPEWARVPPYNYACGPIAASALPAFGDFMYALVQRYSGPPYYVKYWEIWNEPDVDPGLFPHGNFPYGCMGDNSDINYYGGQYYATVLQHVYPSVKAANQQAKVVVGGLLLDCDPITPPLSDPENECIPSKYLEGILAAGGKDFFDGVSFHAYDYFSLDPNVYPGGIYGNPGWNSGGWYSTLYGDLKPVVVAKAQYIKYLFGLYGVAGKFLINTETSLLCGSTNDPPGGPGCEATPDSPFEKLKAAYVPQTYAAAIAEGLVANIWYSPIGWRNSGLLNEDLTTRPAYEAFMLARDTLKNATLIREINEYTGNLVFGYEFSVGPKKIWVIWTLDGKTQTINLPELPDAAWDELGEPVESGSGTLTVQGLKTIYLDWGP